MVVQWFLDALGGMVLALLELLPEWDLGLSDVSGLEQMGASVARLFSLWFPLDTLVTCLLALLACRLALGAWNLVLFVYHQFWGSS